MFLASPIGVGNKRVDSNSSVSCLNKRFLDFSPVKTEDHYLHAGLRSLYSIYQRLRPGTWLYEKFQAPSLHVRSVARMYVSSIGTNRATTSEVLGSLSTLGETGENRMYIISRIVLVSLGLVSLGLSDGFGASKESKSTQMAAEIAGKPSLLWKNPGNVTSRNLLFGSGGEEGQPRPPFTFLKEDHDGTNPKFEVSDSNGVMWKVKLGVEAKPETVASRLVWAVGYYTDDDYFLPKLQLVSKPHLRRGQNLLKSDNSFLNVRLKRIQRDEKKLGNWKWSEKSLKRSREYDGLRVMMALINNWDLKNENNAIYGAKHNQDGSEKYLVSDLGATFGKTGLSWTQAMSKGNVNSYRRSKFIRKVDAEFVDFNVPTRPALINIFALPNFVRRLYLIKLGKHVPRDSARWMGGLLAQLSPSQIRDAFRAGGYSAEETETFARVVEERIAMLQKL